MSADAVKDSKPSQNVSSMKPEPSATKAVVDQAAPKVPVEANEATESPAVSHKLPVTTPPPGEQNRKSVTESLKKFGQDFQVRLLSNNVGGNVGPIAETQFSHCLS